MGVIRASLRCMRCRYELLGMPLEGRCPECGFPVATSLTTQVDHLQHAEVALTRPVWVAAAVVANALAVLFCVVFQLAAPMLASIDSLLGRQTLLQGQVRLWGWMVSFVVVLLTVALSTAGISRREAALRSEWSRWRTWMMVGLVAWMLALATAIALQWNGYRLPDSLRGALPWVGIAIQLPGMTCALAGFHPLLAIAGRRSQALREARAARQSVSLLNGTAALVVVSAISAPLLFRLGFDWLSTVATTMAVCTAVLLLFGAAYLLANAWWVARALVLPKPRTETLVQPD
jgi:hypothetical protein